MPGNTKRVCWRSGSIHFQIHLGAEPLLTKLVYGGTLPNVLLDILVITIRDTTISSLLTHGIEYAGTYPCCLSIRSDLIRWKRYIVIAKLDCITQIWNSKALNAQCPVLWAARWTPSSRESFRILWVMLMRKVNA